MNILGHQGLLSWLLKETVSGSVQVDTQGEPFSYHSETLRKHVRLQVPERTLQADRTFDVWARNDKLIAMSFEEIVFHPSNSVAESWNYSLTVHVVHLSHKTWHKSELLSILKESPPARARALRRPASGPLLLRLSPTPATHTFEARIAKPLFPLN